MIRPRRTFQDRHSAARWEKLRQANRTRSYMRVALLLSFVLALALLAVRVPKPPAYLHDSSTKFINIVPPPPPEPVTWQDHAQIGPSPSDEFNFVLGAEEATEVIKEDGAALGGAYASVKPLQNDDPAHGALQSDPEPEIDDFNMGNQQQPDALQLQEQPPIPPEDDSEKTVDVEEQEFENTAPEAEPINQNNVVSIDGTVGGPDIGGTYDGKNVILYPQITLPDHPIIQHYDSTQNYWPLHSILRARGWSYATMALPSRVTLWISRGAIPPRLKMGYQMLNSMGVSGCIGGAKSLQLECRRRLARLHGCEYEELKIQPRQYNMLNLDDCRRFFADAEKPERTNQVYLSKPTYTFHGAGIRIHQGAQGTLKHEFGACKTPKNVILMDYIARPATMMGGYKFDFRTYLLVASLKPQLVFYHDGFVRKSDRVFDLHSKDLNVHITNKVTQSKEEHFFNFTKLGHELHRELGLPIDHLDTYVRPRAKAVSRFLFQTTLVQPQPPRHVPGRFHLFGIDWLLDASGKLHLLEGNGYPLVTNYQGIGLTPKIWEEMMDLILAIQTNPSSLTTKMTVKEKFEFGGWKLVFNELEEMMEKAKGKAYNACKAFEGS